MKQLVVFDLDGTLAASKSAMDTEMITLFDSLLALTKVAIISGGDWPQFEKQVLARGLAPKGLANLSLLPTCGTKFYTYRTDWKKLYSEDLTDSEKHSIVTQMNDAVTVEAKLPSRPWDKRRLSKRRRSGILILANEKRYKNYLRKVSRNSLFA
jgi:phosphomannomutase